MPHWRTNFKEVSFVRNQHLPNTSPVQAQSNPTFLFKKVAMGVALEPISIKPRIFSTTSIPSPTHNNSDGVFQLLSKIQTGTWPSGKTRKKGVKD